ncbi:MAG: 3-deoxy-manno-octulosonate cytidylyltransferase [Bacteroidia bacterium]
MKILGVIPARFASSRFPGKPLIDIQGKSMIQRVYEQSKASSSLSGVIVATDDARIYDHVSGFGGDVMMTGTNHPSGTDRCQEVLEKAGSGFDYVINIQGDEPFIDPSQIDLLAALLDGQTELATLIIKIDTSELVFDTGEVKVVLNTRGEAMYFSRSPIPFLKGYPEKEWHTLHTYYRHVGLYGYRADILGAITKLPPSALEKAESLEQLRWIENGFRIRTGITVFDSHCIDSPDDIEKAIRLMKKQ